MVPAKSSRQQRLAVMSSTPKGRATLKRSGRKPMPVKVAKDYQRMAKRKK